MVVVVVAAITLIVVVAVVVVGYIRVSSRLKFLNVYIGHISSLNTFINVPFAIFWHLFVTFGYFC